MSQSLSPELRYEEDCQEILAATEVGSRVFQAMQNGFRIIHLKSGNPDPPEGTGYEIHRNQFGDRIWAVKEAARG